MQTNLATSLSIILRRRMVFSWLLVIVVMLSKFSLSSERRLQMLSKDDWIQNCETCGGGKSKVRQPSREPTTEAEVAGVV